jgi:hypothetical protein
MHTTYQYFQHRNFGFSASGVLGIWILLSRLYKSLPVSRDIGYAPVFSEQQHGVIRAHIVHLSGIRGETEECLMWSETGWVFFGCTYCI